MTELLFVSVLIVLGLVGLAFRQLQRRVAALEAAIKAQREVQDKPPSTQAVRGWIAVPSKNGRHRHIV